MKKILIGIFSLVFMASCVDSLDDFNVDQKRASAAPPETLFTGAVKNMTDILTTPNVNSNNFRFYAQQWTSTQYLDEPRYNMTSRLIPQNLWQTLYRDVLADLQEAKKLLEADQFINAELKSNQMAQIEIMEVYAWSVLVNAFGDIPYTEALDATNSLPKYDNAQTVYNDLLARLDVALGRINTSTVGGFGEGDIIYNSPFTPGTKMAKWAMFGNSLKLKLAMVIADVDNAKAKTLVEAAAPNVFQSNADNAKFPYMATTPNNNPISSNVKGPLTNREDYVAANTIVDRMNTLNDPRRPFYFTELNIADDPKTPTNEAFKGFRGGIYGFPNTYTSFSTVSAKIANPAFEALLLDYSEVEFLLAEAAERGYSLTTGVAIGTAAEHYNRAVTASITYWGGTATEATNYLAQPAVAYTTAAGDWRQKIGTQKWIALYNRGFDAWTEWRRLDAPNLLPPTSDLTIPTRMIYPINEQTLNGANRSAAGAAIGGDVRETKLFWDVR
ncbi:SusD/RagB family nutrient-binding outer membrane lipoprotein [Pontibacter arcticus]|uniref:SusD/RagB family nutrient-binding outer membrane lipoprotein n=1 Tax=Pontibacter arcticus TaxID=2080288 RepID=A0A364RB70_9BACT|nr:SusD/RagB family nutrient-binding outer membrane lipoprotein [Pontibacter arcticus]RAU81539.1 SusD/RagB family nutrient-binding outer membrane lipoprotein [Pontibacter arcticus]